VLRALPERRTVGAFAIEEVYMPTANTPEDTSRLIGEAITAGDIDAALSLYEPDATFAMPRGFGEGSVTGTDGLREAFSGFLAMSPDLTVSAERTLVAGDTALVIGNWTLKGRDADGNDVQTGGRYADVVRRQPDGNWLFVIDNPNGSD
jgi:ketosteroid isomerase-like protein